MGISQLCCRYHESRGYQALEIQGYVQIKGDFVSAKIIGRTLCRVRVRIPFADKVGDSSSPPGIRCWGQACSQSHKRSPARREVQVYQKFLTLSLRAANENSIFAINGRSRSFSTIDACQDPIVQPRVQVKRSWEWPITTPDLMRYDCSVERRSELCGTVSVMSALG